MTAWIILAIQVYLGIGLAVLVAAVSAHLAGVRRPTAWMNEAFDAVRPRARSRAMRTLDRGMVQALTAVAIALSWPRALTVWLRELREARSLAPPAPPREFAVQTADLRERLSSADIEAREWVTDPLHAVPNRPFGHLHAAWQAFVAQVQPGDELWSFETVWTGDFGWRDARAGYVAVRGGRPGAYILRTMKALNQELGGSSKVVCSSLGDN